MTRYYRRDVILIHEGEIHRVNLAAVRKTERAPARTCAVGGGTLVTTRTCVCCGEIDPELTPTPAGPPPVTDMHLHPLSDGLPMAAPSYWLMGAPDDLPLPAQVEWSARVTPKTYVLSRYAPGVVLMSEVFTANPVPIH